MNQEATKTNQEPPGSVVNTIVETGPAISETNAERRAAREQSKEFPLFILIIGVQCEEQRGIEGRRGARHTTATQAVRQHNPVRQHVTA